MTNDGHNGAAIATPSYGPDLERCRLLCESIDRHVSGMDKHYLLVSGRDVSRFRQLESRRREVVDERDILPSWLHDLPDPTSLLRRRIWVSTKLPPLRGWHVQQLRRIAIAAHIPQKTIAYCDSDVLFLKDFHLAQFWHGSALRLYRRDDALPADGDHLTWSANAGRTLGLPAEPVPPHDYISTVIAWRRDTVLSMMRHVESRHGTSWVQAVARVRKFSECILYGRYVDEVLHGAGHFHADRSLCKVYWDGPGLDVAGLEHFAASMTPEQVAVGIQSFTGTNLDTLRRLLL
ncbi:hypothetical protein EL18_02177 [Nitratireductor basaltis]|uniref:Uncharacterized protein n=2 Tax=Nitratireductor basaltis TaxID=472175 RepID=A0A084UDU7_9HYPH|nr:hypothetical protein EL18_02177 [Nitratireductor basaltis]